MNYNAVGSKHFKVETQLSQLIFKIHYELKIRLAEIDSRREKALLGKVQF